MSNVVIYRGPLERSRVSFLLETMQEMVSDFIFVWIYPGRLRPEQRANFERFIEPYRCSSVHVLEQRAQAWFATRRQLHSIIDDRVDVVMAIGFSSVYFLPRLRRATVIWCINGIPEEEALSGARSRVVPYMKWQLTRLRSVNVVVVVSSRMEKMVRRFRSKVPVAVAPTCVDVSTFALHSLGSKHPRRYFGYLGTGAEWQALDLLAPIWQALHEADDNIQFRVISRDPRTRVLGQNISPDKIEFVQSDDIGEVARYLHEVEVGFLVRKPNVVNSASFPTKLGEYLAAGAWVVTSRIDWDVEDFVSERECGVVLEPRTSPEEAVRLILAFREAVRIGAERPDLEAAAARLDRPAWVQSLASELLRHAYPPTVGRLE